MAQTASAPAWPQSTGPLQAPDLQPACEAVSGTVVPLHLSRSGRSRLRVDGLTGTPDLAERLERGLSALPEIRSASASTLTGNVVVHHDPALAVHALIARIQALVRGEPLSPPDAAQDAWHRTAPEQIAAELRTDLRSGLTSAEAQARLAAGANTLPPLQQRSALGILAEQFASLPVLLLAGAAAISLATGALLEAGAIAAVVVLNAGIGYTTESRTERTIQSLGLPGPMTTPVVRDGSAVDLPAEALVPGDLITLQRGMVVPADARLLAVQSLSVSEAALTGESLPVAKAADTLGTVILPLAERTNMVYRGTIVTGGSGTAVVVATGAHTEVGRIQRLVADIRDPATPIQRQLDELGRQLVWVTLLASAAIFGVGLLRGLAALLVLRSALSVAVAAVPEGLPMVATSTLALGVEAMRRRAVLVRRLEAIETLAAADVICFDKTGTLTFGTMSVAALAIGERLYRAGAKGLVDQAGAAPDPADPRLIQLLRIGSLCSEAGIEHPHGQPVLTGSATENALIQAALDAGIDVLGLRQDWAVRSVQHRTEAYRFMATVHAAGPRRFTAVKGSPDEVLARCRWDAMPEGGSRELTADRRAIIRASNDRLARDALRVLGFAYRESRDDAVGAERIEDLIWVGLVGLSDPVRPGLDALMQQLHRAGLQTIMLTGDQSATARAVGEHIGLNGHDSTSLQVLDSVDLDRLAEAERGPALRRTHAFARISPAQKLAVVRDLQRSGATVVMVGDGVNDSPALRAADVGIALGRDGPAAAREVADIFLESDDPRALLLALERGRATATNIRKAIHYLLSTNASEILLMLMTTAAGFGQALSPIQLLWINLISDVLPGIGLALEPPEPGILDSKPMPTGTALVDPAETGQLAKEAALLTSGALAAALFGAARYGRDAAQTRTMTFGSLTCAQLLHALTCRSGAGHRTPLSRNPVLGRILAGSFLAQGAALLVPGLRGLLGVGPIGALDGLVMLAGGVGPFLAAKALSSSGSPDLHFRRSPAPTGARPPAERAEGSASSLERGGTL
ncbi:cation-translocating P-type ATPase [Methylobacterium nodulans]|uniref:ATPase, P-type (Transporting), HAD superfamily, subfamily IC n=1 Tax=Methylobacterium nodulans (strain LMG 21967 / CNCM I-2342 / ORS 2060) TaxID=460265 RepID=B8IRL0_METNO|nr:HAD-IC family P-type ATPase [Methylobacterium nodulans]ACL60560.1 ATPase, P-type (transporting), HAD superfamily, subfamily IC [Methylobacterium nodulans ORS 2060]